MEEAKMVTCGAVEGLLKKQGMYPYRPHGCGLKWCTQPLLTQYSSSWACCSCSQCVAWPYCTLEERFNRAVLTCDLCWC
jgi:hypothetical protein